MFRPAPPRDLRALPDHFRFVDIEVDIPAVRVTRASTPLALEPKAFDLLLLLSANRDRVVEKDEIIERLWRDVGVTDNALTRVVAHLRRDLGDEADRARYIETVRTRGYRFLPELEPLRRAPPMAAIPPRRRRLVALSAAIALATAVIALIGLHALRKPAAVPPTASDARRFAVQMTFAPGYDGEPSFSPDGQSIAYTSERDGALEIFIRRLDGGPELQITHGGGSVDPAFSPDGRWIAFHSRTRGGLWLVSSLGGEPRQLTESGSQPAWSPDGRQIAFRSQGGWAVGPELWPGAHGSVIAVVDVSSGHTRQLTTMARPPAGQGSPAWLPDGRAIVFAAGDFDRQGIYVVGADDGVVETMVESPGNASDKFEVWRDPVPLPDGTAILAVRSTRGDSIERLALPARRREPVAVMPLLPLGTCGLAASPDGRRLAYALTSVEGRIEMLPVDDQGHRAGSPRTIAHNPTLRLPNPRFSPDGQWIVCRRFHPGAAIDNLAVNVETGAIREIAPSTGGGAGWGRWWASPTEVQLGGVRVDIVTGRRREIGDLPGYASIADRYHPLVNSLQLSPDGSCLLFAAAVGRAQELFSWPLGQENAVQVTRLGRIADYPVWSRDGTRIVAQVADVGAEAHELWVLAADGANPRQLPTAPGRSWTGSFSPTGATVTYAALRGAQWDVAVAGPDLPERLFGLGVSEAAYVRYPDWSPLGDQIAYEHTAVKGEVWVVPFAPQR